MDVIRTHQAIDPFQAIVNVAERTGLLAIAPHFDLMVAGQFGHCHLAAHGCRGLFAAAVPCSEIAKNIMETHDAGLDAIIFAVVGAQAFHDQFFPAIGILRHGRVGILFLQRNDIGLRLFKFRIDTCRGSIEISLARH